MNELKPFTLKLLIITALLAIISALVFHVLPDEWATSAWPAVLGFLLISNVSIFAMFLKAQKRKLSTYANFFMLATFLKLVVYLAIIIVYLLFNKDEAPAFLLSFFIYYSVFTFFEVKSILRIQKSATDMDAYQRKPDNSPFS